jgi:hypothetical protein
MAGLGRKVFTAGEVLTAANVQGYLMDQSVMVFASSAARSSAIPTPSAGMVSYLSDTSALQVYGTAWADVSQTITSLAGSAVQFGGTTVTSAFTATAALENGTINVNGTAAVTVTIPDVLNTFDSINIIRNGGTVTIAAGTGVTDWAGAGTAGTAVTFKIDQQYNGAQVIKVGAGTYRVIGKITV